MITPMKKVTVLTVAGAVEETLQALRTLEILHLTPLQAAAGAKLNKARVEMNRVQKALEVVPEKAPKGVTPVNPSALRQAQGPETDAMNLIDEIQNLVAESKQAEIDKEQAEEELSKLSMFKNLDPATAAALQAKGIYVKLYQLHDGKIPFELEGEGSIEEFGQDENGKYVAVVSRGEAPVAVKGNSTELTMPQKSLAEYREMEAKATRKRLPASKNAWVNFRASGNLSKTSSSKWVTTTAWSKPKPRWWATRTSLPCRASARLRVSANSRRPPANTAGASWWTTPPKTTISRRC